VALTRRLADPAGAHRDRGAVPKLRELYERQGVVRDAPEERSKWSTPTVDV
jgi:hypothetical protein